MEIFLIVMLSIISFGLIFLSVFILSYYSLNEEKGFGNSIICKFTVVRKNKK
jgi:hypothetical protein